MLIYDGEPETFDENGFVPVEIKAGRVRFFVIILEYLYLIQVMPSLFMVKLFIRVNKVNEEKK